MNEFREDRVEGAEELRLADEPDAVTPDEQAVENVLPRVEEETPSEEPPLVVPDSPAEPVEPAAQAPLAAEPTLVAPEEPSEPAEHAPGELDIPDGVGVFIGSPNGTRRSVGIAISSFNGDISTKLLEGALEALEEAGVDRARVDVMQVPGAFELPLAAMALAKTRRYACIVALGCVIRGDTPHFEYIASEAASGIQLAALETGVPVSFGVLTCDSRMQAEARAGGRHGNKGAEAARSALEMADVFARLRSDAVVANRR